MIRACIYSGDKAVGCVTPSAVGMFEDELSSLREFGSDESCVQALALLETGFSLSVENNDASFLDALKRVKSDGFGVSMDFLVAVSKAYWHALSYCCSNQVFDEAMSEAVSEFNNEGLMYIGHKTSEFGSEMYSFSSGEATVFIEMCDKDSLYSFFTDSHETEHNVVILTGTKRIRLSHCGDICQLCEAVKACICDFLCDCDEEGVKQYTREDVVKMMLEVARMLIEAKHGELN